MTKKSAIVEGDPLWGRLHNLSEGQRRGRVLCDGKTYRILSDNGTVKFLLEGSSAEEGYEEVSIKVPGRKK